MTTYRADCHSPDNFDQDRRIQGLGGVVPWAWYHSIDTIISMIGNGDTFYTLVDGQVALIVVERHPTSGRLFLKTIKDTTLRNNLLYLPRCPGR